VPSNVHTSTKSPNSARFKAPSGTDQPLVLCQ
jgi:hypothetical protein